MKPTDTADYFDNISDGLFSQQIGRALSDVADAVLEHDRWGTVTIHLHIAPAHTPGQVKVTHSLAYRLPNGRGRQGENITGAETTVPVTAYGLQPPWSDAACAQRAALAND